MSFTYLGSFSLVTSAAVLLRYLQVCLVDCGLVTRYAGLCVVCELVTSFAVRYVICGLVPSSAGLLRHLQVCNVVCGLDTSSADLAHVCLVWLGFATTTSKISVNKLPECIPVWCVMLLWGSFQVTTQDPWQRRQQPTSQLLLLWVTAPW